MISFVCWKWTDPRGHRLFSSSHVNVLARSIARNFPDPHRFICVTDDSEGLAPEVVHVPMPVTGFEHLLNPSERPRYEVFMPGRRMGARYHPPFQRTVPAKPFPSCYRRLWVFSEEARELLGDRVFCLDVDTVVLRDLRPLVNRPGSFVGWVDHERFAWKKVAGGAYMLTTGAHPEIWKDFDAQASPAIAAEAGYHGSDQAWMSYRLHDSVPYEQHWQGTRDGLWKLKWIRHGERPPAAARLIFTSGDCPPWDPALQRRYPWITEHWR